MLTTVNGALTVAQASTLTGAVSCSAALGVSGIATMSNTTDATSTTAAGTVVSGGLGVAKTVHIGQQLSVAGNTGMSGTLSVTGQTSLAGLSATGDASFSQNVSITGDLNVEGNLVSVNSKEVNIGDRFMYLAAENTSTSATSSGVVVNCKSVNASTSVTYTNNTTSCALGAGDQSDELVVSGESDLAGLSAGDFVQISQAATEKYNGIYEVESVDSENTTMNLKSSGQSEFCVASSATLFAANEDSDWSGATFTHVLVGAIRCNAGEWQIGNGNNGDSFVYTSIATSGFESIKRDVANIAITRSSTEIIADDANGTDAIVVHLPDLAADSNLKGKEFFLFNNSGCQVTLVDGAADSEGANGLNIDGNSSGVIVANGNRIKVTASSGQWWTL